MFSLLFSIEGSFFYLVVSQTVFIFVPAPPYWFCGRDLYGGDNNLKTVKSPLSSTTLGLIFLYEH